jgi:ATP-dependent helicase/nuclease subunit B
MAPRFPDHPDLFADPPPAPVPAPRWRGKLYSIAPHARFLATLADRILDGTLLNGWPREGAFWLSDITIVLPTRRARLALAEIFAQRLGGAALLPDIRTFGGESAEEEPFLPPVDAPAPIPIASPLERRLTLSRLVRQFAVSAEGLASPPNAAEVLWLSDSLGALVDDLTIEQAHIGKLAELLPDELAGNWQDVLRFLEPALKAWPATLAERGKADAAAARNARLYRQAATAPILYGDRPMIAAGSTGSIPATAALLEAIALLPRGAVVLPGLDTSLSADQHKALIEGAETHGHPQYGLGRLLRALGAGIGDVDELAGAAPRTGLVRAAMSLADETAQWAVQRQIMASGIDAALEGVSIIEARNADIEARAVALAARQGLVDGLTVGIVSRDQTLARRIAAELNRYGIEVDDPAGTPLFQTGAGRLARQLLAVAANRFAPVDVVALLYNAAVTLGLDRGEVRRQAGRLDLRLRNQRPSPGLAGMLAVAPEPELRDLLDRLGAALAPLCELFERPQIEARDLAATLMGAIVALAGDAALPGRPEFEQWAEEIASLEDPGAAFPPAGLDDVLAALMAGIKVPPGERRRDDIHIWGELEARLMNPGLLILAGVNEDIWPAAADPGPWLSRGMRLAIGLSPPERQQGQAAHDFAMALGNARVIVAYAGRIGTAPALPSRFLQRLDAYIGAAATKALRARGRHWLEQAAAIDYAGIPRPAQRPMPRPAAAERPRRLSITEIEPLMRSPYEIYAKLVLKLRRMQPLGKDPDARERGNIIHKVFERFVTEGLDLAAPGALDALDRMAAEEFAALDMIGERRDIWLRRFRRAAQLFLEFEHERGGAIVRRLAERKGEWLFPALDNFVLSGKADRIDERADGSLEIIDFKTGGVPTPRDMTNFDAPQLLLEAAMARAGAFPDIAPRDTAALLYIKIGLGPKALATRAFALRKGMSLMQAVDEIELRLQRHVETFLLRDHLPMTALVRPPQQSGRRPFPRDYDHLARTDEWTLTAGVDDP